MVFGSLEYVVKEPAHSRQRNGPIRVEARSGEKPWRILLQTCIGLARHLPQMPLGFVGAKGVKILQCRSVLHCSFLPPVSFCSIHFDFASRQVQNPAGQIFPCSAMRVPPFVSRGCAFWVGEARSQRFLECRVYTDSVANVVGCIESQSCLLVFGRLGTVGTIDMTCGAIPRTKSRGARGGQPPLTTHRKSYRTK